MSEQKTVKLASSVDLKNIKFPELPAFIISALIFLDIGILLGAANSLNFGGEKSGIGWLDDIILTPEIHQTHWTSTLLGGVSILMLGQIYFFFAQIAEKKNPLHLGTLVVLLLWLAGVIGSYALAWGEYDKDLVVIPIKLAILIFLIIIAAFFLDKGFVTNLNKHPPLYHLLSACIWLALAIFWRFDIDLGALDRIFLTTYIYGFFSLTLFGSLSFILPIIANQKPKSTSSVKLNLFLLNGAAASIIYDEYRTVELRKNSLILDLLGPFLWGLAAFLFIMYVFDLVYKSGVTPTLVAMLVALMMFSFFVFDTFMKNILPQWVDRSHFHFMFIGTLLITIIAVGSRLLVMQYDPSSGDSIKTSVDFGFDRSNLIRTIGIGVTILGVVGVLAGFTLEKFRWSAISGVILFFGIVTVELMMLYQMRMKMKFHK